MDIKKLQDLVDKVRQLPIIEREKTVFDIGVRGHFENPTTEVLAFFCDSSAEHGMGDLVINSFISLLKDNGLDIADTPVYATPEREVVTETGKRIDLLLSSDQWILIIENKIWHDQVNPFKDYENYADKLVESDEHNDKKPLFAVLSPQGKVDNPKVNPRWVGVSYFDLIQKIKTNLHQHFFDKPFNKWLLILKDFLLHLENLMSGQKQDELHTQFALENLPDIGKAWQLLGNSLVNIKEQIIAKTSETLDCSLICQKHSWFGIPSFKYIINGNQTELVLFGSSDGVGNDKLGNNQLNDGKFLFIQVHIPKNHSDQLYKQIAGKLKRSIVNHWDDNKTRYLRWPVTDLSSTAIVDEMVSTLLIIHEEEKECINSTLMFKESV
ncbi:MAG: hypothetical protein ACJAS1_006118 [Oleiphilaceae bacterium]|jgi:hypothetical protein